MSDASLLSPITPYTQATTQTTPSGSASGMNSAQNIDAVSKDFEAVFLSQMMGAMFEGEDTTAFFGGGTTGDVYKSYLLNEYGKVMASVGGVGIAAQVKQELLKMQEVGA
jgi:Rod binding domain-containing protein